MNRDVVIELIKKLGFTQVNNTDWWEQYNSTYSIYITTYNIQLTVIIENIFKTVFNERTNNLFTSDEYNNIYFKIINEFKYVRRKNVIENL